MRQLIILTAMIVAAVSCNKKEEAPLVAASDSARSIAHGDVVGFLSDDGTHVWRAIPFAAPPVGDLRWRAPRPASNWDGEKKALNFGDRCTQVSTPFSQSDDVPFGDLVGSEDCLTLDVYAPPMTPDEAATAALPVMVWIHGGGNVSGASKLYDGALLAKEQKVIVVAVQYRLGPFGWFAHEAIRDTAETDLDRAANFGILDIVASLEWVRDNAAAFGGTPDNVTIFGESAGGHNVATLLAAPQAKGLFHRAILQSGSFDSYSLDDAQNDNSPLLNPSSKVAARFSAPSADVMRAASTQDVFDAFELDEDGYMDLPRIIEDGVTIVGGSLREAFASPETFNAVPIISGTNKDEMKLFNLFNPELVKSYFNTLRVARDQGVYDAASDYTSRVWRLRSVDQPAALMAQGGHDEVYAYRFGWDDGGKFFVMDLGKMIGAAHAIEIPFVFHKFQILGDADRVLFKKNTLADRDKLSLQMGSYWANFARTGTPESTVSGSPAWPKWSTDGGTLMRLDTDNDGGLETMSDVETLDRIIADLKADDRVSDDIRCKIADAMIEWLPTQKSLIETEVGCS